MFVDSGRKAWPPWAPGLVRTSGQAREQVWPDRAKNRRGLPQDAVARFHLGNGARLERLNWLGDGSDNGITQSYGLMVNYLYDLDDIEKNHEAYAEGRRVVASNGVKRLMRGAAAVLVPVTVPG